MKIIITGVTGFIGQHVLRHFDDGKNIIYAFGRKNLEHHSDHVTYHKWDICNSLNIHLPEDTIDILIHIAGDTNYKAKKTNIIKNNVTSLTNILDVTKNYKVTHFIYISSSSVYQGLTGILSEDTAISLENLTNNYALSKYFAEQRLIHELNEGAKLSILRPRAVYGEGDNLLLPTLLKYSVMSRLVYFGDGNIKTSLTHVDNLCEAISLVIKYQTKGKEIFNVSDTEVMTLQMIYEVISRRFFLERPISIPKKILTYLERLDKNRFSYIKDIFICEKILSISRIQSLGYKGNSTFRDFINK